MLGDVPWEDALKCGLEQVAAYSEFVICNLSLLFGLAC